MSENKPSSERPPIDLDNEAVRRAQAARAALTQRSGGRNVLIGIGIALAALFAFGLLMPGRTPTERAPSQSSDATPRASGPSSSPSSSPAPSGGPVASPNVSGADVPYVDPRKGPQSGYDLDPAEAIKASGMPNAAVLGDSEAHLVAERIFAKSGIRLLRFTDVSRSGRVSCDASPEDEVSRHASLVENELAVYPQQFLAGAGVQFVALCRDVITAGLRRSTTAIVPNSVVVVDTAQYRDEAYFRATFHRALFSVIDGRERGGSDAEWAALNATGQVYARTDKYVTDPVAAVGSGGPGFITETAHESVEDDKAETFRALLLDNRAVERLAASDAVVSRKVRMLQERLLARSNKFDTAFWAAAH